MKVEIIYKFHQVLLTSSDLDSEARILLNSGTPWLFQGWATVGYDRKNWQLADKAA